MDEGDKPKVEEQPTDEMKEEPKTAEEVDEVQSEIIERRVKEHIDQIEQGVVRVPDI